MYSLTRYIDALFFPLPLAARIAIIGVVLFLMAVISYRRFLTFSGVAGAVVIGGIVFFSGGVSGFAMLLFFFVSASMISSVSSDDVSGKKGPRDIMQVVANGFPAAFALVLSEISGDMIFLSVFAASLAEAAADTTASSIGKLSRRNPLSIITFTAVPRGLSGGVTALGTLASVLGSFVMALLFMGTFGCSFTALFAITASGFLGALFDSFLGASVQVQYRRPDGSLTEKEMEGNTVNTRARGIPFIDNDVVNLLSGFFASVTAYALISLLASH